MADLAGPELPRSSAAVAEPTAHDPDAGGHFGVYGGRFVPEALMAVIEEVTAAYEKARADQTFLDELQRGLYVTDLEYCIPLDVMLREHLIHYPPKSSIRRKVYKRPLGKSFQADALC